MFRLALLASSLISVAAWGAARPHVASRALTRRFAYMSEPAAKSPAAEEGGGELVPINEANIEAFSGVLGGALGLFFTGALPFAAVMALVGNYVSKLDNEAGAAVRGVSEAGIKTYNFATTTNEKYKITDKIGDAVNSAVASAKQSDTSEQQIVGKAESLFKSFVDKVNELDQEFDISGNAKELLWAAGELGGQVIDKTLEIIDENNVTEKLAVNVKKAVDTAKANAAKANE